MDYFEALNLFLQTRSPSYQYRGEELTPIPSMAELTFLDSVADFRDLNENLRDIIRRQLSTDDAFHLAKFAVRMATLAARTYDPSPMRRSTFALVMDDDALDDRDVLRFLSIISDCAIRIGERIDLILKDAIDVASSSRASLIRDDFLQRDEDSRSLQNFGFKAETGPRGLRFVWCG